jgi:FMN phosphatase YigB (HAD superfamily)
MLERAAAVTGVDLRHSVLIGDSMSDAEAARRVGMRGILVERNKPPDFAAAVDRLVRGAA